MSERNFIRILQDAHDADVVDLRRRGDDYEVAPAAAAPPLVDQLASAEVPRVVAPAAASVPTGMGARSSPPARGRGRGPIGARVGVVPANLLSIGVVETSRPAPEPVVVESIPDLPLTGEDALSDAEAKPRSARKRGGSDDSRPRRARKSAASTGEEGEKPAAKRSARKSRKTASE